MNAEHKQALIDEIAIQALRDDVRKWQQRAEAAAAKLVAMTGQPVKQPQTHDAHGFPEPAHILNSRWIEAIRAAGHEVQE